MESRALLLLAFVSAAMADTPANCTYEEILGSWTFSVGRSGYDNTIDCHKFSPVNEVTISLSYPDIATDEKGNKGFWTLIYNQGFEVVVGGRKYFAFSTYVQVDKHTVLSYCNTTFNGWSHDMNSTDWACYSGSKVPDKQHPFPTMKGTKQSVFEAYDMDRKYVHNPDFISEINHRTDLWEATRYPELEEMTFRERLLRAGGVPVNGSHAYPQTAPVTETTSKAVSELPENFDWRDIDGANYVSPIRNQQKCGSCYAFGSMAMLEARVRMLSKNSMQPVFSTQDVVSCSEYSQGCEGGFPYLIAGKYGEDFGVVEEKCFPYTGRDSDSCSRERKGCTRYRTTDYHYIGGYYGACNEQLMQAELVQNGPIAVSFEVTEDFHAYKRGIYHKVGVSDGFNPWEVTNHVVAIVGYGVENGVKYWTVKNSWGREWGEKGFFRIIRGIDELSIESMAVVATPILPK